MYMMLYRQLKNKINTFLTFLNIKYSLYKYTKLIRRGIISFYKSSKNAVF